MAISALPARVLAVPDKEHLFLRVEVCPFYLADFVLTHSGRDSESDDPPDRNFLKAISLESGNQTIQFILRRSSVALIPLPNETKPCERNASQKNGLDREMTPWTAACDKVVLIYPRSIPMVTGPASSRARSFPTA